MAWKPRWVSLSAYSLLGVGLAAAWMNAAHSKPSVATRPRSYRESICRGARSIRGVVRRATYNTLVMKQGSHMSEDETVKPPAIDEARLVEWVGYGMVGFDAYMRKQAAFAEWLRIHDKESDESPS